MREMELGQSNAIPLSFTCQKKWKDLAGKGDVRNCQQCHCDVQDVSEYSNKEIQALRLRVDQGENICVAFRQPLKSNTSEKNARSSVQSVAAILTISLALSVSLSGCSNNNKNATQFAQHKKGIAQKKQPPVEYVHYKFEHRLGQLDGLHGRKLNTTMPPKAVP